MSPQPVTQQSVRFSNLNVEGRRQMGWISLVKVTEEDSLSSAMSYGYVPGYLGLTKIFSTW
jgi:hypothetical protein